MLLLGYLGDRLSKEGVSIYLVGGQAVEAYSAGTFTTGDMDITTTDRPKTERALVRMGFTVEGMVWLNAKLGAAMHIVGTYPSRTERARVIEVGQYRVNVVGVEDLIIDRLAAAKYWKSQRDAEQATVLYRGFRVTIDLDYLRKRASEEGVEDILPTG
jgi:hypothetical protein